MNRIVLSGLLFIMVLSLGFNVYAEEKVIRLGMIGLDTSHVTAFTSYINNPKNKTGCRVVVGYSGGSPDMPASANRVENFTKEMREKYGVEIVDTIEELCEKVDGVMLESVDGRPHLKQAIPVIKTKKPLFVDKPMAASLADVIEIFRLAEENCVPCWTSSSFRYGKGIVDADSNDVIGEIVGCDVFGSSSWVKHHPDLYLYGVHAVEALFAVMGTGCESVRRVKAGKTDMVIGVWEDGRIGTFRDLRGGKSGSNVYIYGKKGMMTGKSGGYDPLLEQIVKFFKTGEPPVPAKDTIEMFAFMSGADESKEQGGKVISIKELIEEAKSKYQKSKK